MSTAAFAKDDLRAMLWGDSTTLQEIERTMVDTSRWSIRYRVVFKHADRFYESYFSEGATELQDEQPWEYGPDPVPCAEVRPEQVTVTQYVRV